MSQLKYRDRDLINQKFSHLEQTLNNNSQYQAFVTQHEARLSRINDLYIAAIQEQDSNRRAFLIGTLEKEISRTDQLLEEWNNNVAREERRNRTALIATFCVMGSVLFPLAAFLLIPAFCGYLLYPHIVKKK